MRESMVVGARTKYCESVVRFFLITSCQFRRTEPTHRFWQIKTNESCIATTDSSRADFHRITACVLSLLTHIDLELTSISLNCGEYAIRKHKYTTEETFGEDQLTSRMYNYSKPCAEGHLEHPMYCISWPYGLGCCLSNPTRLCNRNLARNFGGCSTVLVHQRSSIRPKVPNQNCVWTSSEEVSRVTRLDESSRNS